MATLQKLITQCAAVSGSPTRSPVIHLRRRRRKTLRMLLSRRPQSPPSPHPLNNNNNNTNTNTNINNNNSPVKLITNPKSSSVSFKLKDFLLSSPSPERETRGGEGWVSRRFNLREGVTRGGEGRVSRPFSTGNLRQKLLKKAFRPMLVAIPE